MQHRPDPFALLFTVVALGDVACLPIQGVPSGVMVHARLESPEAGTILYQQVGTNPVQGRRVVVDRPTYTPVCEAPCEVDIDVGSPLYVSGKSVYPSRLFKLEGAGGPVTIKVQPGSWTQTMLGATFVLAGIPTVMYGGMIAGVSEMRDPPRSHEVIAGLSMLGIGLVSITVGAVLLSTSKTTVDLWRMPAPVLTPPAR